MGGGCMGGNALDERLAAAMTGSGDGHHDIQPDDFGAESTRAVLFRECLRAVLDRYPGLRLRLLGSRPALARLAAIPGVPIHLGSRVIQVYEAHLDAVDTVRLAFSRAG